MIASICWSSVRLKDTREITYNIFFPQNIKRNDTAIQGIMKCVYIYRCCVFNQKLAMGREYIYIYCSGELGSICYYFLIYGFQYLNNFTRPYQKKKKKTILRVFLKTKNNITRSLLPNTPLSNINYSNKFYEHQLSSSRVANSIHGPCVLGLGTEGGTGPFWSSETYSPPRTLWPALLISWFPMWEGGEYIAGISLLLATYCSLTGASKVELDKDCFFLPSNSMLGFRGRASDLKKRKKKNAKKKKVK